MNKYHKNIIFCKTELEGYFRYGDEFQIYPAEFEGMPKSKLQSHYPIVLEYIVNEDEVIEGITECEGLKDLSTLAATTLTKQDKIISLLSLFTNHLFFRYYDLTGNWGMPILEEDPDEKANTWSSKWNMAMFHWPEYPEQFKISEFTKLEIPEIKFKEHFSYYFHDPNFDYYSQHKITFPDTIKMGLNSYFNKKKEVKDVLNSAISFIYSAMELRQYRKTMSIIASFTSIETMVNFEYKDVKSEKCDKCGQEQFKVTQKYRDYLLKYIGNSIENKKKINAFYKLRSSIIHSGQLLKTEDLYSGIPKEEKDKEFLNHIEIIQMSKLAVIHWLNHNPK